MRETPKGGGTMVNMAQKRREQQRLKFGAMLLHTDHSNDTDQDNNKPSSNNNDKPHPVMSPGNGSPYAVSPWSQLASPFAKSPWATTSPGLLYGPFNGLVGSLVREEGHVYSLAVSGELLYTGSESKNIRVWKNLKEFTGFKSNSGLVKAIVVAGDRIFTGHQDGKIRVWRVSRRDPKVHRRVGSLPSFREALTSSVNPKNYVEVRRKRNVLKIRHFDAVSSMSLDHEGEGGILYSASWDKTVKAWRVSDSKCLDSFAAHDDAVNAVAAGPDGLVFTGSADGTVKAWRREISEEGRKVVRHSLVQTILRQENAVTAVAVGRDNGVVVYCGSSDGAVNFWELQGKRLSHGGVLRGHRLAVLCLAVAGNLLFTGSADKNICVWRRDPAGGAHALLSVLTGHAGPVKCLAVEREENDNDRGWIVYSGSLDKSVKVWRVSEHAPDLKQLRAWEQHCAGEGYAPSPRGSLAVTRLGQKTLLRQY